MPALAEVQAQIRAALVEPSAESALPLLLGGRNPRKRLAIHRRHYEASLVAALLAKFPGCVWLLGDSFMTEAARSFVHRHPPAAPCITEYGAEFPGLLATSPEAHRYPYVRSFAELEWHLSHVAVAIEAAAVPMSALAALDPDRLAAAALTLQPGLRYVAAQWPVDELIEVFLSEHPPERFAFEPQQVTLELRGARGTFSIGRIDPGTFAFRSAIAGGLPIVAAAERALAAYAGFDPGRALAELVGENLVTAVVPPEAGGLS